MEEDHAWEQLVEAYQGNDTALVGTADCVWDASLCFELGVRVDKPSIKYGDPNFNLEDYKGGRDFEALKAFADANLGPKCGPSHLELCDEEKKAEIIKLQSKLQSMSVADLEAAVAEKNGQIEKIYADFKKFTAGQHKQFTAAISRKDVEKRSLDMMKSVLASRKPKEAPAATEAPKSDL